MLNVFFVVLHLLAALFLILFVLLHSGKGGGLSDMFGGAAAGLSGGTSLERKLDRITVATAVIFALTTVTLGLRWA
jgi:preprotein translocase subunit SecG